MSMHAENSQLTRVLCTRLLYAPLHACATCAPARRDANSAMRRYASAARKSAGNWILLPGWKDGRPRYGHVAQRKASPKPHCKALMHCLKSATHVLCCARVRAVASALPCTVQDQSVQTPWDRRRQQRNVMICGLILVNAVPHMKTQPRHTGHRQATYMWDTHAATS